VSRPPVGRRGDKKRCNSPFIGLTGSWKRDRGDSPKAGGSRSALDRASISERSRIETMIAIQPNGKNVKTLTHMVPLPRPATSAPPMMTPTHAWRLLCRRTGGEISRTTFYRWLSSGKVVSVRLGYRLYIPFPAIEDLIKLCLAGERY
jgi:hypothetical protein